VNTDASAQATVDAPGGDSRSGLSPGWVVAGATILALAIRLFTLTRPAGRDPFIYQRGQPSASSGQVVS
jgi:hypothetical protein